jgi:hypothetical protein
MSLDKYKYPWGIQWTPEFFLADTSSAATFSVSRWLSTQGLLPFELVWADDRDF